MSTSAPPYLDALLAYLPIDRRQALARGQDLPERTHGAALFADISGFTALAEALAQALGPRPGAEELTRQLDRVYGALIAEVDRYGGSVIGFSGDAVTCWLDQDDGRRAVAAALAMQRAMEAVEAIALPDREPIALGLKAAITTGPVRRFVVGDPQIQRIDVLAGELLDRLALAEQQAGTGEIVLERETAEALRDILEVRSWRQDGERGYAVVGGLTAPVEPASWPVLSPGAFPETGFPGTALPEAALTPWLLPAVANRIRSSQADFLADLRPAVALFLRFGGIDFEAEPASGSQLDAYVRWVQQTVARFEGTLIQVTIGDKGSYLYVAFGAPLAHEDDTTRAVAAALALSTPPAELGYVGPVQIGISRGQMRAGPYGGPTRRTYGVLGDEVNVAARLMQAARLGQILVTRRVAEATRGSFNFVALDPVTVKGKSEPLEVLAVRREPAPPSTRAPEPAAALPLVGREAELAQIEEALGAALGGAGQVVALVGEAGVGKSRLVTEAIRLATARGAVVHVGEGQSYGTNAVYLAWHTIWRSFFGVDPEAAQHDQIAQVEAELARINPSFRLRLPLLSTALNLTIPDNEATRSIGARERNELLEALLVDCVRAQARTAPLLLVLEDCHWLDPLSWQLVEAIAGAVADVPVLLVLAARPLEQLGTDRPLPLDRVTRLPHCRVARLDEFGEAEAARLIRLKLAWQGRGEDDVPAASVEQITARTGGNPFYIEELLSYLHDRRLDPRDPSVLARADLPESLHSLILSRIDHLREDQQVILKVASVVGRQFVVRWLWGAYPDLGEPAAVTTELDRLRRLDITLLDTPEPDLSYLFKHAITQEVAYESQPRGVRATLHEHLGQFIESTFHDRREQYLDLLAYHYGRTENLDKQRQYYREAGEHAAHRYANAQAVTYFTQALALTPASDLATRFDLVRARYSVFDAQSAREQQAADLDTLTELAEQLDEARRVEVMTCRADYLTEMNEHRASVAEAREAARRAREIGADALEAWAYQVWGGAQFRLEEYAAVHEPFDLALTRSRASGSRTVEARTLNGLGVLAGDEGDYPRAREMLEQALRIYRDLGDLWFESMVVNNLGLMASYQGDLTVAQAHLQRALDLAQATGNRRMFGSVPARLGDIAYYQGQYALAGERYSRALPHSRAIADRRYEVHILCRLGLLASVLGEHERARSLGDEALALARLMQQPRSQAFAYMTLGHAALGQGHLDEAAEAYGQAAQFRRQIGQHHLAVESLAGLARVELARAARLTASGHAQEAPAHRQAALAHVEEILAYLQTRTLDGTDERFRIYLTCYQVLALNGDPRAQPLLERANRELLAQADQIEDAEARRSFLEAVPWHRELRHLAATLGA